MFNKKMVYNICLCGFFALGLFGCNKTFENQLKSAEENDPPSQIKNKVLFVMIDGLVGAELQTINPPTVASLTNHSIYSFNGVNSIENDSITNAAGWATLLTGVNRAKHGVADKLTDANNLQQYPSILTRLKATAPSIKTVAITTSQELGDVLMKDASEKYVFAGNDDQANTKALDVLEKADVDLLAVQFGGVDIAGRSDIYKASSAIYKQAVLKVDGFLNQMVAVLKKRAGYDHENWMIVIASNKGSNSRYYPTTGTWNAFDDPMHNTFIAFYNLRFLATPNARPTGILPYSGFTPAYTVSGSSAPSASGGKVEHARLGKLMDFGANTEFTMQCKIKYPAGTTVNYPSFLGKRAAFNTSSGSSGFLFFLEGDYWGFNCLAVGQTGNVQSLGSKINDGKWHTLTGVVRMENGTRTLTAYTDGTKNGSRTITANFDFSSTADFTVGWRDRSNGGVGNNVNLTDIRVYNAALSEAYITGNYCTTTIAETDPYKTNLVGFWPNTAIFQTTVGAISPDMSGRGNYMIQKNADGVSFYETSANVCPPVTPALYASVPNSPDVAAQIYAWLGISPQAGWGLDGKGWTPQYIDVIN